MEKPTANLAQVYDAENFRATGHQLVDQIADYLAKVTDADANPAPEPQELLANFQGLLHQPISPNQLFEKYLEHSLHVHAPAYMGHQVNPPAPLTALCDLLNGVVNGSTAIYEMGKTGAVLERIVIEQFAAFLQLGPQAGGFLTNGGTLANLTALLAARAAHWPEGDPWQEGTQHFRPCLFVNEQAHYCIDRAAKIMGWGAQGVINIPADEQFRIRTALLPEAIAKAKEKGLTPIAIVGSAGTTSTGSFDDLNTLADIAEEHNLWYHIDGAHGAPVYFDPQRKHLLEGLNRADSLIMDFHKMMMVPSLTTGLFFSKGTNAYRTFHQKADYLLSFDTNEEDQYNFGRRTFECTKNMMSLRVFSLLACYGKSVFSDYVIRVNEIGRQFADVIRQQANFELALAPDCNIVCFRFRPIHHQHSAQELDALNSMIRAQLVSTTNFYIVQTKLRGRVFLRCTFTNPFTNPTHTKQMLQQLQTMGESLSDFRKMPLP